MTFAYPLLLGGLVLAGIPVLIHLVTRQKPKRLPFPAFRFLLQKHRTNQTRLRLRQLLLLLLRMAIIAALCLALVRPTLTGGVLSPLSPDRPVSAVLLIDTSYSMQYGPGDKTRLDEAKRRAGELLDELPEGSKVAVLDSAEVGGEPQASVGQARERIAGLKLRHANAPLTRQIERAYPLFEELGRLHEDGADAPKVLYVFSDRTRGCWDEAAAKGLTAPPGVTAVFVDVGVEDPADLAIVAVKPEPATVRPGDTVRINVTVQATGSDYERNISCKIDGDELEPKPLKVQAGRTQVVAFEPREPPGDGLHQVEVRLDGSDALPFDNAGFTTFRVLGGRPLLILADDREAAQDWADVVSDTFRPTVKTLKEVSPEQLELDDYAAVCLFNVAEPKDWLWDHLKTYVTEGHGLAVILGGQKGGPIPAAYNDDKSAQALLPVRLDGVRWADEAERYWAEFQGEDERLGRHPLLAPFLRWKREGNITFFVDNEHRPRASRFWHVRLPEEGSADVLTHYTDKDHSPALVERVVGRGTVLVLTTGLERAPGGWHKLTDAKLNALGRAGVADVVLAKLKALKDKEFETREDFGKAVAEILDKAEREKSGKLIEAHASRGPWYQITDITLAALRSAGVPQKVLAKLKPLKDRKFDGRRDLLGELGPLLGDGVSKEYGNVIVSQAELARWNNYFPPFGFVFSHMLLGHLAGDTKETALNYITGDVVPVPLPAKPFLPTYTLAGPGLVGSDATLTRQPEQRELRITQATTPGNFLVLAVADERPQRLAAFSMNPRPDEHLLDRIPVEQIEALLGEGSVLPIGRNASLRERLQERGGRPLELMPLLLIALLLFLAFEALLANRFYRRAAPDLAPQDEPPPPQAASRPAELAKEAP
jgi:hypothetical protein